MLNYKKFMSSVYMVEKFMNTIIICPMENQSMLVSSPQNTTEINSQIPINQNQI